MLGKMLDKLSKGEGYTGNIYDVIDEGLATTMYDPLELSSQLSKDATEILFENSKRHP